MSLKDIYVGVVKNDENRRAEDFYPTPPIAAYILHKYSDIPKNIVEPCAGRGNLSVEFERCEYNVKSYDLNKYEHSHVQIETGQDVLKLKKPEGYEGFITNPPYFKDLPKKITEKGIAEYEYTAMFVRLTFLEGMKRSAIFKKNPPSELIILSDRIRFQQEQTEFEPIGYNEQIGGMIAYAWVIWNKNTRHENTKITWVALRDEYNEWFEHYEKTKT